MQKILVLYLFSKAMFLTLSVDRQYQFFPQNGQPPTYSSFVSLSQDEEKFRITFKVPTKEIVRKSMARDHFSPQELYFCTLIKPGKNSNTGYLFGLTANNVQIDGIIHNYDDVVYSWDEIWLSRVETNDTAWEGEMEIPIKILRELTDSVYFGFVWSTFTSRGMEIITSSLIPAGSFSRFDIRFADICLPVRKNTEDMQFSVTPYFALIREDKTKPLIGGDLKFFSNNSGFQFTIKPESYSLEADIDQFNIKRRRSIRLEEKRPFFTEGLDLWKMPTEIFYTRKIKDIFGGIKYNYGRGPFRLQGMVVLEDSAYILGNYNDAVLAAITSYSPTKSFQGRWFFLRKGETLAYGMNANFYLPKGFKLKTQYTKAEGSDWYAEIYRYSKMGFWMATGGEKIEPNFTFPTAFISYFENTVSLWFFGGYNWYFEREFMPQIGLSTGYVHSDYIGGEPFERFGNFYVYFYPVKTIGFSAGIEPMKTVYQGVPYENFSVVFSGLFGAEKPFTFSIDYAFGRNFGNNLNYLSMKGNGSVGDRLGGELGMEFLKEGEERDCVFYLKGTYRVLDNTFLRLFVHHSTLSSSTDLNFMFQREFFAGSNFFLVVNRAVREGKVYMPLMLKVAYEVKIF
ncbi:MAG: hypothetical protein ABIM02_02775 [candidate division WOR-3 bacterium]